MIDDVECFLGFLVPSFRPAKHNSFFVFLRLPSVSCEAIFAFLPFFPSPGLLCYKWRALGYKSSNVLMFTIQGKDPS